MSTDYLRSKKLLLDLAAELNELAHTKALASRQLDPTNPFRISTIAQAEVISEISAALLKILK